MRYFSVLVLSALALVLWATFTQLHFVMPAMVKGWSTEKHSQKKNAHSSDKKMVIPISHDQQKAWESGDLELLMPVVTLNKSVAVQGGGSPLPGDTLLYTILLSNSGVADANNVVFTDPLSTDLTLIPSTVKATPIAVNDAYTSLGNVGIVVNSTNGLLSNDVSPDNTTRTVVAVTDAATTDGGKITINTDGSFDYTPKTGTAAATDSYVYTLNTSSGSSTATVTITIGTTLWFIDDNAASGGDGSLSAPYDNWSVFGTNNTGAALKPNTNQVIFIYGGSYSGNVTLLAGQKVIGESSSVSLATAAGITVPAHSKTLPSNNTMNVPTLTSMAGNTVTLSTNNLMRGMTLGNSGTDISGTAFGTFTIADAALNGNGAALSLVNGVLNASLSAISSNNSSTFGISLTTVSGSLSSTGGTTITNPNNEGIVISINSSVMCTFNATSITGSGSASVLLNGSTTNTSTVSFTSLNLTPDAGVQAISTFFDGTLNCTSGTIATSNVSGLSIAGASPTNTASLNMVLNSYTCDGSSKTKGASIINTVGSFTITGTGSTNGSGGTISSVSERGFEINNAVGVSLNNMNFTNTNTSTSYCSDPANNNAPCFGAIHIDNGTNITLNNVDITGTNNSFGVNINGVNGFNMTGCTVAACGSAGAPGQETGGIYTRNLNGTCVIQNSLVNNSFGRGFRCLNTSGTMNLTVTSCEFKNAFAATNGNSNFLFDAVNNTNNTIIIKGSDFSNPKTYGIQLNFSNGSNNTVQVGGSNILDGNIIQAATMSPGSNAFALQAASNFTGIVNYNIQNNNFQNSFAGVDLFNIGNAGSGAMQGRCNNNTATAINGINSNGIVIALYGSGSHKAEVLNNVISGTKNYGIVVESNDNGSPISGARVDATVQNNTINMISDAYAHFSLLSIANSASGTNITTCGNIGGNITNDPVVNLITHFDVLALNSGSSLTNIILQGTNVFVPAGGGDESAAMESFWEANNPGNRTALDEQGGGMIVAGTCLTPSNPGPVAPEEIVNNAEVDKSFQEMEPSNDVNPSEDVVENSSSTESEEVKDDNPKRNNNLDNNRSPNAGEIVTVNGAGAGFTLPTGKSTTITFSAIIANNPANCTITNEASVSGSNIPNVSSNITNTAIVIPTPTGLNGIDEICNGESIDLVGSCSLGNLEWYNIASPMVTIGSGSPLNVTPSMTTTFQALCEFNGCESTRVNTGVITVRPLPTINLVAPDSVCTNDMFNISADAGASSYVWTGNGIINVNNNATTATPTLTGNQQYKVVVTNSFGCSDADSVLVFVNSVAMNTRTGTGYCSTLQQAIDEALSGDTLMLLDNVVEMDVVVSKNINIKGNGFSLTIPAGGSFDIANGNYLRWFGGNLILNGDFDNTGATLINNGNITCANLINEGSYRGRGTLAGTLSNNGNISPGN